MCALLSIVLLYFDAHGHLTQRLRYALQGAAYPMQVAVSSPGLAWRWLTQSFVTRAELRSENAQLLSQLHDLQLAAMREQALERENAELRGLHASLPPLIKHWQLAEIIGVETDPLRQRIIIDKGADAGVTTNQAVVDGNGVLGQVERVGPWSSEVILVTDPGHEIPVEVTRNNLRSIAVGNGGELLLPYLAANSDVHDDDLLVSSGLGGVFPAGLPVARIVGLRRDTGPAAGQIRAQPLGNVSRDREVILLQFEPQNPDAPTAAPPLTPNDTHATGTARAPSGKEGASTNHAARPTGTTPHTPAPAPGGAPGNKPGNAAGSTPGNAAGTTGGARPTPSAPTPQP